MTRYRIETPTVARVAGLPASALQSFRLQLSWRRLIDLLDREDRVRHEGEELSAALFAVIGSSAADGNRSGDVDRAALVGLRRAVFTGRRPARGEWTPRIAAGLPADLAGRLETLFTDLVRMGAERGLFARELATEVDEGRLKVRAAALHPMFRHALAQASPSLSAELDRWAADDRRRPRRRTLVGLCRYLSRAAAKTSPYSTFTTSALGTWVASGDPVRFDGTAAVQDVTELDRMVLGQLVDALTRDETLRSHCLVRVNPSARVVGGTVFFLGRRPAESIVGATALPEVLACVEGAGHCRDLGTLVTTVAHRTGAAMSAVRSFVDRLVDAGLLEVHAPLHDQSEEPLRELAAWLVGSGVVAAGGPLAAVPDLLGRLRAQLRQPVDLADGRAHTARRDEVAGIVAAVGNALALDWPGPETLRKLVVHESSFFAGTRVRCARSAWQPVLDDLDMTRRWLGLHDRMLPVRIALREYCAHRFGIGGAVPFLALHEHVQRDLGRGVAALEPWLRGLRPFLQLGEPVPAEALEWSAVPRLRELHRLRSRSRALLLSTADGAGTLRVHPAALGELAAGWPKWVGVPGSVACYGQPYLAEDGLRLAVNAVSSGYGRGRSRWVRLAAWADEAAGGTSTPVGVPRWPEDEDPVLAEISGTFGVSVNLRSPVAPVEVDYPFTVSVRPADERIPLHDLVVRNSAATDLLELYSARLGRVVRPVHLGMMADPLLPPAARLMLAGFGQSYLLHTTFPLLNPPPGAADAVTRVPRLQVGRLTLQRARWIAPRSAVPLRGPAEPDADYLLRLVRWLRTHGVPPTCYVRVVQPDGPWQARVFAKSRKPLFIDFANFFLVLTFEHLVRSSAGEVWFDEALPAPEKSCGPFPHDPRVTEFIVELSGPVS